MCLVASVRSAPLLSVALTNAGAAPCSDHGHGHHDDHHDHHDEHHGDHQLRTPALLFVCFSVLAS